MIAALLLASALPLALTQDDTPAQLILEGVDGSERRIPLAQAHMQDPRTEGAWLLRPVGIARAQVDSHGQASPASFELASGDRLRARVRGGEGEALDVQLVGDVSLALDISEIRSVVFTARVPSGNDEELAPAEEGDRLYRVVGANLDRIDGTVLSFSEKGVEYESEELGARLFPWKDVAALFVEVFEDELVADPSEGTPVVLDLVDESRVRGRLVTLDGRRVSLRVGVGEPAAIAWKYVREVFVDDGRLAFLSSLPAAAEEGRGSPFGDELGMVWPFQVDRSVQGATLRAGGRDYLRGIGAHAPSRIRFALDGAWSGLRAKVGIDDSALLNAVDARGSVIFRVFGDGKLLWESGVLRGGDQPLTLPDLELTGVRELVLESDPDGDFAGDRANWLRPLLVRGS